LTPAHHRCRQNPYSSKRVRTYGQEHPYGAHLFTPSLFFYKSRCARGKMRTHISMPILCVRNVYTWGPRCLILACFRIYFQYSM